jgi:outer membrane protein
MPLKGIRGVCFSLIAFAVVSGAGHAKAETIEGALAKAYAVNPDLNAQRAAVRANDENVPRALSLGRPTIRASGDASATDQWSSVSQTSNQTVPRGLGLQLNQTLYNFGRTDYSIQSAESGVLSARAQLATFEQTTLLNAATAYMDVLRDTAFYDLRRANIDVLKEQLRQTQDRFNVGEVTRTDVAQVEARLASATSDLSAAEGTLKTSIARYRQTVGADPKQLAPARPLDKLLPRALDEALRISQNEHPSIVQALFNVEAAEFQVKLVATELAPSLSLTASAQKRWDYQNPNVGQNTAQIGGTLNVPIYEGGEVYARVRQAKETLAQRQLDADTARDRVRADVVSNWSQLDAARARIISAEAQIQAATVALNGIREEAKVGQRTTLDVLLTDQDLLSARVTLVAAQRDRVVASYQVIAAMGRLNSNRLGLKVVAYDPAQHYRAVRDKLFGTSLPSER